MKLCVFDIEGDSLDPTIIHCMSAGIYSGGEWRIKSTTNYEDMRKFFSSCDTLVGHNIARWDIPVIERLLDIKVTAKIVDTLAISWYLYPNRNRHGLEYWGEDFGIPKPKIEDWENLSIEEYIHRCEEDVKINCALWDKQFKDLDNLYVTEDKVWRFLSYLEFKMDCAREAESSGWLLDTERCSRVLKELEDEKQSKMDELSSVMPQVRKVGKMKYPKNPYKKDGTLSSTGRRWFELLHNEGLPEDHREPLDYTRGYEEPNPASTAQVKDWLFSLGWKPETFKHDKKDGETRKIEQVRKDIGEEKILCQSVKKLFKVEPKLSLLEGLSVLTHRIGILKGFLSNVDDKGYIQAQIQGLANTLRFKHKVVVNLPNIRKPYGKDIRGVLIAPKGYELCGSDMSSLEDRTKQHFMWDYDPEYVREMMTDDFDPHLDLAVVAGFLTEEQAQSHKKKEEDYSEERAKAKTANYACVYGAMGATVARGADMTKKEGTALVEKYWERNWSVKEVAKNQNVKRCLGGSWLYNPVSRFWYSLRYEKDRFSTLNQGTGVFCFDCWIKNFREYRPQLTAQMHDEVVLTVKKGNRDKVTGLLKNAIEKTNEQLKLNRELDVDVQFGDSYAEIH